MYDDYDEDYRIDAECAEYERQGYEEWQDYQDGLEDMQDDWRDDMSDVMEMQREFWENHPGLFEKYHG